MAIFERANTMTKQDYSAYWKTSAAKDWKRVNLLFRHRDYVFALHCAHLVLEKLCKAHWIKDNTGKLSTENSYPE